MSDTFECPSCGAMYEDTLAMVEEPDKLKPYPYIPTIDDPANIRRIDTIIPGERYRDSLERELCEAMEKVYRNSGGGTAHLAIGSGFVAKESSRVAVKLRAAFLRDYANCDRAGICAIKCAQKAADEAEFEYRKSASFELPHDDLEAATTRISLGYGLQRDIELALITEVKQLRAKLARGESLVNELKKFMEHAKNN